MCGIAGYIGDQANKELLTMMLGIMKHRGPDASGSFAGEGVCLGHNRLAINDLSANANQPFVSSDGSVALVVNGEIYNFRELRRDLEQRGHLFSSQSDSEVVLHGYLEFGDAVFSRLNGMFAIAIWDGKRREVILARDRLGIKQLYYANPGKSFLFASELKALAQCRDIGLTPDLQALSEYLVFENYFEGRTLNSEIRALRPGELVVFGAAGLSSRFFWQPEFPVGETPGGDLYERYRELSRASVERHLVSDVPVGCYLSAGIDSSTVTYWANSRLSRSPQTFTGSFGMSGYYDESQAAAKFASILGCSNEKIEICPADFRRDFEDICWHLDEPRAGMGAFSQYLVARRAAEKVKVILTGHGGDEFFAGYPVFKNLLATRHPLAFLKNSTARELILSGCFALYPLLYREADYRIPVIMPSKMWQDILSPDIAAELKKRDPALALAAMRSNSRDKAEEATMIYLREYLPSLFMVEDKISMAFSLESRTPLCDNELLDFALSLPLEMKLKGLELKHIPRQAMRGLLPDFLFNLPKRGFPTPLRIWFKGELKAFVREYIAEGSRECRLFNRSKLLTMTETVLNSRAPYPFDEIQAHRLWVIMSLIAHARMQKNRYVR